MDGYGENLKYDEFKITKEEAEKLMKTKEEVEKLMKSTTITTIKSCPYLLPCGFCDKRGALCNQYE